MRYALLAMALVAPMAAYGSDYHASRTKAAQGHPYPECYCTNRGVRVELGQTACLNVGGRSFTARCDMSLNNPAWREVEDGCPADGLSLAPPARPSSAPAARG